MGTVEYGISSTPSIIETKRVSGTHHMIQARVVITGTIGILELFDDLITIAQIHRPTRHVLEPPCGIEGRLCRKCVPDRRGGDGAGGVEVCDFVDFATARSSVNSDPDKEPFLVARGNRREPDARLDDLCPRRPPCPRLHQVHDSIFFLALPPPRIVIL